MLCKRGGQCPLLVCRVQCSRCRIRSRPLRLQVSRETSDPGPQSSSWCDLAHACYCAELAVSGPCALSGATFSSSSSANSITTPCASCVSYGFHLAEKAKATVYSIHGVIDVEHVRIRCTKKSCIAVHYYNFHWRNREKPNSLHPDDAECVFITSNTGFEVQFLTCHDALQFRGLNGRFLSGQLRIAMCDSDCNNSAARLLWLIMEAICVKTGLLPSAACVGPCG